MKRLLLLLTITGAMSAQDFHGISIIAGPVDHESGFSVPVVVNSSTKTLVGFAVDETTVINAIVGFHSIARGTGIAPGEQRAMPGIGMFGEGDPTKYPIKAVLFHDMTLYGNEQSFQDFAYRIATVRSMARDVQYSQDKVAVLEFHRTGETRANPNVSIDHTALRHRADMANILLQIRESGGDMEAAVARLAALPDVVRGEEK